MERSKQMNQKLIKFIPPEQMIVVKQMNLLHYLTQYEPILKTMNRKN